MDLHHVSSLVKESRTLTESEFGSRHGGTAFLIEPFDTAQARDLQSATAEWPLEAAAQPAPFHQSARLGWLEASQGIIRLGRDAGCEIVLPHPRVSKHHAIIHHTPAGWFLADERSTNGTTLNERLLGSAENAPLQDGDAIGLAGVVILRPFFKPALLHALLRGPETPPAKPRPSSTEPPT